MTTKATFKVTSNAARWWVVIEPIEFEFEKPKASATVDLQQGVDHAVVYYVFGKPGQTFKLTGTADGQDLFEPIDREIGSKGFAYGHKGFKP